MKYPDTPQLLAAGHQVAEVNIHATWQQISVSRCIQLGGDGGEIGEWVAISLALSWTRVTVKRTIRRQIINTRTLLPRGTGRRGRLAGWLAGTMTSLSYISVLG